MELLRSHSTSWQGGDDALAGRGVLGAAEFVILNPEGQL